MRSPLRTKFLRHFVATFLLLWLWCFWILAAAHCAAQTGDSRLNYGDVRRGHLDNNTVQELWTFSGQLDDVITIKSTRTSGDVTLTLGLFIGEKLTREGLLTYDDPVDGTVQSTISSFELPTTGTFLIVVCRKYGSEDTTSGDYRLELALDSASGWQDQGQDSSATLVSVGNTPVVLDGTLAANHSTDQWLFEATQGDKITVTVESLSGDLIPAVNLWLADRELWVIGDDNRDGDLLAQICYQVNAPGTYRAVVSAETPAGAYRITIAIDQGASSTPVGDDSPPDWSAAEAALRDEFNPGVIEQIDTRYNHQATNHLDGSGLVDGSGNFYLFFGVANDTITITMMADPDGAVDPYLSLYYYDAVQKTLPLVAYDDESGGVHNAEITAFTLPHTGIYVIHALSIWGDGDYTITLAETGVNEAPNLFIDYGQTVTGEITLSNDIAGWTFAGNAGDQVYVIVERQSGNLLPDIGLLWEKSEWVYSNLDMDEDGIVDITTTLDRDGNYTIMVQSRLDPNVDIEDADSTTGRFALTLLLTN